MISLFRFFIFSLNCILFITGCNDNPTASENSTRIGGNKVNGLDKLREVSGIILLSPPISPNINATPRIRITGLSPQNRVYIYSDAQCSKLLVDQGPSGTELELTLPTLSIGTYTLYAKRRWKLNNIESDCSTIFLAYEVLDALITGPQVDSMMAPTDSTYNLDQSLDFTITFNKKVLVTSLPRLSLLVGSVRRYASYSGGSGSGTLSFTYDTENGDLDSNGISFVNTSIDLDGGGLKDDLGNDAFLDFSFVVSSLNNVNVDAVIPVVSGLSNDDTYRKIKSWSWGCSKPPCTYRSIVDTSSSTPPMGDYTTARAHAQTAGTGIYYIHVQAKDSLGNESDVKHVYANLDNTGPQISSMTMPADSTYNLNQDLNFTITFDEDVEVTSAPRLSLSVGSATRYASYFGGSGSRTLSFAYDTESGDLDFNGINFVSSTIDLNGGTLKDDAGNDAVLDFSSFVLSLNNVNVDAVIPIVSGLSNDDVQRKIKNWSWGCSKNPCTYRFRVDTSSSTPPTGGYTTASTHSQTAGTGIHYIHVQAKDSAGNESDVKHVYANLDNTGPQISSMTMPADSTYSLNQDLNFMITFDENVEVTSVPRLSLSVGLVTRYASYFGGSGSRTLSFTYDTESGDLDSNGISFVNTSIDLNGGTLKDDLGNNAVPVFPSFVSSLNNVNVDAVIPVVSGLSNDDTYRKIKNWSWGCSKPLCTYRSIVDTSSSTPPSGEYTPARTHAQAAGTGIYYIHVQAKDSLGNESDVKHVYANLDNTGPQISSMTMPADSTYNLNQDLNFTITFDEDVEVTSAPRLSLSVGLVTRYASYFGGSGSRTLSFAYDTESGDLDSNGISFVGTTIDLNGGTLKDDAGNDAVLDFSSFVLSLNNVNVDAVIPVVNGLSNDDTYRKIKNWSWGCSKPPCTYRSIVDTSSSTPPTGGYTTAMTHSQTAGTGIHYIHVQAKDSLGNESDVKHVYANLDNTGPQISSMTIPHDSTYSLNQDLNFTITFDEDVLATSVPRLSLSVGLVTRYASYFGGSGSRTLSFTYDTEGGDLDSNGISFVSTTIDLNGGTLKDNLGNDAVLDFSSFVLSLNNVNVDAVIPVVSGLSNDDVQRRIKNWSWGCSKDPCTYRFIVDTSSSTPPTGGYTTAITHSQTAGTGIYYIHVQAKDSLGNESDVKHVYANLDNTGPQISSMTIPADSTYNLNQDLNYTIIFDKNVEVTSVPRLSLSVGLVTRYASYSGGSGSRTLSFTYDTEGGDLDSNGISFVSTSIDLNGGTLKDNLGNDAVLDFSSFVLSLSNVNVDAVIPVVSGLSNDDTYRKIKNWSWGCSKPPCTYRSIVDTSSSTSLTGGYTTAMTHSQTAGTGIHYIHVQAKDSLGNESDVKHVYANLDNTGPQISSMTMPADSTYNLNQDLNFMITFDEDVEVTSVPRLSLSVGLVTRYASYFGGSGSRTLSFTYDTESGDLDSNGISFVSTTIDLNGGALKDNLGNDAVLDFSSSLSSLNNVNVDAVIPIVSGLSNDDVQRKIKNWSWGCSKPPCTYRFIVDTSSSTSPTGGYTTASTHSQTAGTGIYYIHVQAKDSAGNESDVKHVYANLDNMGPQISSMTVPADSTYNLNQDLNFTIIFDKNVEVTSVPRLSLSVGLVTRYASYFGGSGSRTLSFAYDTESGDLDSNGISFVNTSIDLNGGALKDDLGNDAAINFSSFVSSLNNVNVDAVIPVVSGLSNDDTYGKIKNWSWGCSKPPCTYRSIVDTSSSTPPTGGYRTAMTHSQTAGTGIHYIHVQAKDSLGNESDVKHVYANLDNTGPQISSMTMPADSTYNLNQDLNFTITFDENVLATSAPRLSLSVGLVTRYASYFGGSGSRTLSFTYDTESGDLDSNGISFVSTTIDLNGGTLKDNLGNDAMLDFSSSVSSLNNVNVDTVIPVVSGLSNDDTDRKIKNWSWGCNESPCTYRSIVDTSSSTSPTGGYTTASTHSQTAGTGIYYIHVQAKDSAGNESDVKHVYANLDNTGPQISSMTMPADSTYNLNQDLNFTIIFDEDVEVTSVPRLSLSVGLVTRYASYFGGSGSRTLSFTYDTESGDLDSNGISFVNTSIDLNGGALKDDLGNDAAINFSSFVSSLNNVNVDAVIPVVSGLSNDDTYRKVKNWSWGCSKPLCTYRSIVDTSSSTSPTGGYTTAITHSQTVGTGIYYIHVQAKDSLGNESDVKHVYANLDNTGPQISSMTMPADSTYNLNQDLNFTIIFHEDVLVTSVPRLSLSVGLVTRYASYSGGSGSRTLSFAYDTESGDLDSNGISFVSTTIDLNGGTLKDNLGNDAVLDFSSSVSSLNNVNVDAVIPIVSGLSNDDTDRKIKNWSWGCNENPCTYRFIVDTSSSTSPTGGYTTASTHSQTVGTGIYYIHVQAKDSAGNESDVKHVYVNLDNMGPQISSMTMPVDSTYSLNQDLNFTITFDEDVEVTSVPRLSLSVGLVTRYASYSGGSGSRTLSFAYDTESGDLDSNGISFVNTSIDLNGGTLKDDLGNNAVPVFPSFVSSLNNVNVDAVIPVVSGLSNDDIHRKIKNWSWGCSKDPCTYRSIVDTSSSTSPTGGYTTAITHSQTAGTGIYYIHVQAKDSLGNESDVKHVYANLDNTGPQISSMTMPADSTYNLNQDLNFTITFHEDVLVTSVPRLSLSVGLVTRYASYSGGSGSRTLSFAYDTESGDLDSNGISFVSTTIDLNGGTLKDNLGNDAVLDFSSSLSSLNNVNVDAVIPIVSGLSNDDTYRKVKNWSWGCSKPLCTYRSIVDTSSSTSPTGGYTTAITHSQTAGTGIYYIHVQAKDSLGNESDVKHVYANLDNTGPQISSMTMPADSTYNLNQDLNFTITFDEDVEVTSVPRLSLSVGLVTRYASYSGGSGSRTLSFAYDTESGDLDSNGISFVSTTIDLNGGTLKDDLGNDAALNFPSFVSSLNNVNVDAVIPVVSGLSNDDIHRKIKNWSWGCSKDPCTYRSIVDTSSSTSPTGGYTTAITHSQTPGTGIYYIHVQAKDSLGNESDVKHVYANLDNTGPQISSMTMPADSTYNLNQDLNFTITFHEDVLVTSVPRLSLSVGLVTRYASYSGGSGSRTLSFAYDTESGDLDSNGISFVSTTIDLNGGTLKDNSGNDAVLDFSSSVSSLNNVNVDGAIPIVGGLSNDDTYQKIKNWSWGCNENPCTYRFIVDTSSSTPSHGGVHNGKHPLSNGRNRNLLYSCSGQRFGR